MKALSVERSLLEGKKEVKELFEFVTMNAANFTTHKMEQAVFSKVMQIGLTPVRSMARSGAGQVGQGQR